MDSGPAVTFQVHEYLRPKVNIISQFCAYFQFADRGQNQLLLKIFFLWAVLIFYSSVIYMKMTQFSTNSNAVWAEMDCVWPLVHTGNYFFSSEYYILLWHNIGINVYHVFVSPAIFFVYLVVLLEAMKQLLWKLVKIQWGIVIHNDGNFGYLLIEMQRQRNSNPSKL